MRHAIDCVHCLPSGGAVCRGAQVMRVQMQLDAEGGAARQFKGSLDCAMQVLRREGLVKGWYAGISAGIFRQLSYGMPRMAFYTMLLERFKTKEAMPFAKKLGLGLVAGGTAALIGVPSEVCLVRMGADSKKPEAERRNYKNVVDAITRIAKEEGVVKLWSGAGPTIARACLLNAGQLGVYSEAKEVLEARAGLTGIPLQFIGSLIASVAANSTVPRTRYSFVRAASSGVARLHSPFVLRCWPCCDGRSRAAAGFSCSTVMACPADVMKSRMQNALPGAYTGMADCVSGSR